MAFTFIGQVGANVQATDSTATKNVTVTAGVQPQVGDFLACAMTKSVGFTGAVTDVRNNQYIFQDKQAEPIDGQVVCILTCVVSTALITSDTIALNFAGTFSSKTGQVWCFRPSLGNAVIVDIPRKAASVNPHNTQPAGTLTNIAIDDLLISAHVQDTTSSPTWTPQTNFTSGSTIFENALTCGYLQYNTGADATGSLAMAPDSSIDASNAGVSICFRDAAPIPKYVDADYTLFPKYKLSGVAHE